MRKPGAGTYLAQGAAANAIVVALILLGILLYHPMPAMVVVVMVILPIYLVLVGILGGIVGLGFWFVGFLFRRKLGLLTRAAVGIVVPLLITLLPSLAFSTDLNWPDLLIPLITLLIVILPAALMSGSRFNPMRSLVLGLEPAPPLHDFGRAFSFFPAVVLRFGSTLGLLEAMVYLANSRADTLPDPSLRGDGFPEGIMAVFYFGVTAIVSFGLPRKHFVVLAALLSNVPVVMWVADPPGVLSFGAAYVPSVIGTFVGCWCLFVLGRLLAVESTHPRALRILPVTFLEIRIRHALNQW
jgi:hypothetical protein